MVSCDKDIIHFLIVDSSAREAESFLNIFRENGFSTRASQIDSMNDFIEATSGHQHWDLMLIAAPPEGISYSQIFDYMNQKDSDVPAIIFSHPEDKDHEMDELALIKMGARAIIPIGDQEYLFTIGMREFNDLKIRRQNRLNTFALHESEKQRKLLLDEHAEPIVYVNNSHIKYVNPALLKMLELPKDHSFEGKPVKDLLHVESHDEVEKFLLEFEETDKALDVIECFFVNQKGSRLPVSVVTSPTSLNGGFALSLQIKPNVDAGQSDVSEIIKKSGQDQETGLINRKLFEQELDITIQRSIEGKRKATLCCLHLENLKTIHDQYGKEVSQKMLKAAAKRITAYLGNKHHITSMGGANFSALIREEDEESVSLVVGGLLHEIAEEGDIVIDEHTLPIKLSIGAVVLGDTAIDPQTLISQSRQATVQAQQNGGSQLYFYQKRKVDLHSPQKQLASIVNYAVKNKKIKLNYQPVVSLDDTSVEYYEVSFTVEDEEGKEYDATEFRAALERNSFWNNLDRWQLVEAGKALAAKRKEGSDTRLLMHFGGFSMTDSTFVPWIKVALKAAGIPGDVLAIELSEQNLSLYPEKVPDFFRSLKEIGCQTVVSEFGCSLKPLDAIAHLDIDLVKLDQSFTENLSNADNTKELQKIIEHIDQSGRKVIVPGIETSQDMNPVWQFGADFIQGSFMQAPSEGMNFDFGADR